MGTRTDNDFAIASNGEMVAPFIGIVATTKQQAYRTAVWLKEMGEVLPDEDPPSSFDEVEEAIRNT